MSEPADKLSYRHALPPGQCGHVCFGRQQDGVEPAWDFWQGIKVSQQASFLTLFRMIVNSTTLELKNRQKFKKVEGLLYEFKSNTHQMRIFCFRHEQCWYLTSGLAGKKEDDLPPGEVKRALAIMDDCRAELACSARTVALQGRMPLNSSLQRR
jgi:hypothetical protein